VVPDPRALSATALVGVLALALSPLQAHAHGRGDLSGQEPGPEPEQGAPHERTDLPSRAACGGCHPRELAEWSRSLHARAWTNANIRLATDGFRKVECRACHSPLPVLPEGLDQTPDYRDHNQDDGVQCLACHGLAEGVAAARSLPEAPCRPLAEPRLATAELCWPCHEPTHHAFQEFHASRAFAEGRRCQDCHMPERAEGGHFHGDNGGFNAAFVRRALEWHARVEGDELVLELQNRTGHKFPGEISSRSFLIRVRDRRGEPTDLLLRKPHRGEEREDDRLVPDEHRVLRFPLAAGDAPASLELRFLPLPLLPPEEGHLLGSWSEPGASLPPDGDRDADRGADEGEENRDQRPGEGALAPGTGPLPGPGPTPAAPERAVWMG